jgi:Zinc dependent phospholipase C
MATWIAHLRVAERVLQHYTELDETGFVFGNLAPDSGIPNEDWSQFDPPKTVTHLLNQGEGEDSIRDLEFYRDHVAPLDPLQDRWAYSFSLGYFCHLICDGFWSYRVVPTTMQECAALLEQQGESVWRKIKDDWYSLDRKYVCDHPDCIFWRVMMREPNPCSPLPFLSERGLHQNLDYIRDLNSKPNPDWIVDRAYPYLNEAMMARIVEDNALIVLDIFAKRDQLTQIKDRLSALALIEPQRLEPYPSPLGD